MNILFAGDGGQGIQTIASIFSEAIFSDKKFFVSAIPNFGLEQRGGVSLVFVRLSDEEIKYPKFSVADILLILSEQADARTQVYRAKETLVIDSKKFLHILQEENIEKTSLNIFLLGFLTSLLTKDKILTKKQVFKILKTKLEKKANWLENKKAFSLGFEIFNKNKL